MYTSGGATKRQSSFLLTAFCFKTNEEYTETVQQEWSNYSVLSGGTEFQIKGDTTSGDACWLDNAKNVQTFLSAGFLWWFCQYSYNRAHAYEEQIYFNHVYFLNSDDINKIGMCGVQTGLPSKPKGVNMGDSGGVVNSLDFCPASLKSFGCFYFRCVLCSHW